MAPLIPDRWLNYIPVGKRIEGTRFIAFKVPLREDVNKKVEETKRLDANILLKTVPKLGMIIDLTNTSRYYNPNSFVSKGVEYNKLMVPGHHTPQPHLVKQFKDMVLSYSKKNPDNDKLIGVHCTHGVNRTGYLICHFMISELDMKPEYAIDKFNTSRGHQIERKNYLDSLNAIKTPKVSKNPRCVPLIAPCVKETVLPPSPQAFDQRNRFQRFRQEANEQRQRATRLNGNNHNYSSRYVNTSRSRGAAHLPHHSFNHNSYHTMHSNNNQFTAHAYVNPRYDDQANRNRYIVENKFSTCRELRPHLYTEPPFNPSRPSAHQRPGFDELRSSANRTSRLDGPKPPFRYNSKVNSTVEVRQLFLLHTYTHKLKQDESSIFNKKKKNKKIVAKFMMM